MTVRRRRLAALVAMGLVTITLGGPVTGAVASPSHAAPTAPPTPVRVLVDTLRPLAPTRGDTVVVAGTLLDTTDVPINDVGIRMLLGPVLTRGELHLESAAPVTPSGVASPVVDGPDLSPRRAVRFVVSALVDDMPFLGHDGVHALQIQVTGTMGGQSQVLGAANTFLPIFRVVPTAPTELAWVLPLVATPRLGAPAPARSQAVLNQPAVLDDTTAHLVAPGGRLDRLLQAGRRAVDPPAVTIPAVPGVPAHVGSPPATPLTWAVDPALLEELAVLGTSSYVVNGSGTAANAVVHPRDPRARTFLARLSSALRDSDLMLLPYADADLVGLHLADLDPEIARSVTLGVDVAKGIVAKAPLTGVAWPPGNTIDQGTLDALAKAGTHSVLLDDSALAPLPDLPYTPTAGSLLQTAAGPATALVGDAWLDQLVADAATRAATPRLAEQLFLAETAMITAQRPSTQQSLLVLPPRAWDPNETYAASVMADSAAVPWLRAVPLATLLTEQVDATDRQPLTTTLPSPVADPDLLRTASSLRAGISHFASVLDAGSALLDPLQRSVARGESAAFRRLPDQASQLVEASRTTIHQLMARIRVAASRTVTLTGSSSSVPVTIANDLDVPVSVTLSIAATNRVRVRSMGPLQQVLKPRSKTRVQVPVRVEGAGTFPATLTVRAPDGQALGQPLVIVIRSAAYGPLALGITIGALAVLAIAVLLRLVRRLRATSTGSP